MKIKEIKGLLKGCYSAFDVGEKEVELDTDKVAMLLNDYTTALGITAGYSTKYIAQALAKANVIKVKEG